MKKCSVCGMTKARFLRYNNETGKEFSFHPIPSDKNPATPLWNEFLEKFRMKAQSRLRSTCREYVCSLHFTKESFLTWNHKQPNGDDKFCRALKEDAYPSFVIHKGTPFIHPMNKNPKLLRLSNPSTVSEIKEEPLDEMFSIDHPTYHGNEDQFEVLNFTIQEVHGSDFGEHKDYKDLPFEDKILTTDSTGAFGNSSEESQENQQATLQRALNPRLENSIKVEDSSDDEPLVNLMRNRRIVENRNISEVQTTNQSTLVQLIESQRDTIQLLQNRVEALEREVDLLKKSVNSRNDIVS